jgi:SAM-dependent methyltransferase
MRPTSHFESREQKIEKLFSNFRFNKIIRYIPRDSDVLDLGCGYHAYLLKKIENRIKSGVGIDISTDPNFCDNKIRLIKSDLNNALPFGDDQFDCATSLANLEHLEKPQLSMNEIHRVLKPGGILLLTAPTIYAKPILDFLAFKLKIISREEIADHKNYFNKKTLFDIARIARFRKINHQYFQFWMNNFLIARK